MTINLWITGEFQRNIQLDYETGFMITKCAIIYSVLQNQGECQTDQNFIDNQKRPNQIFESLIEKYQLKKLYPRKITCSNKESSISPLQFTEKSTPTHMCRQGMCGWVCRWVTYVSTKHFKFV